MSEVKTSKLSPRTASGTLTLGTSGDTFEVPSGVTLTNNGTVSGFGLFSSYAIIADQKTTGTDGGTFTSGDWRTRDLNTEIADPDGIVSISSNQFTLGAGSYLIRWSAPANQVGNHQSRLYDVTGTAEVEVGSNGRVWTSAGQSSSTGSARVSPSSSNTYSIEHECQTTATTNGFGYNFGLSSKEQYTVVEIFKEA